MKTSVAGLAVALATLAACGTIAQTRAAPPTVTPSPGYDARLQERQKSVQSIDPATPVIAEPVVRHRSGRHHHRSHR
ncbi:MAG: hypothetical protein JOY90_05065 [Bradyrhizobium sp.]|uniref:hypothetical protein n=1 Tax=Bradyrhizobium sp. TaxID=376 RepID=UPI001D8DB0D2|nr:hypothetical protein [Bradyrhizobium sp.]MBV9559819.1 hypothetical protein [Bradyrhizobium sp.]